MQLLNLFFFINPTQVLSFTHPVSFHSAETFESLLGCLKMDDEKVAEAALQIFKNTGSKMEESFPHIKSYVQSPDWYLKQGVCNHSVQLSVKKKKKKENKKLVVHILGGDTCFEHAALFVAYGNASYGL